MEVLLRDVTEADLPILYEHQRDPEAIRMAAFRSRDREAFAVHWAQLLADPTVVKKAVVVERRVVGNVVCFEQADERLVGYWIGREHWGKGIATRALALLLEIVPERPLHARLAKHNLASRRVLEKNGFRITGEDRGLGAGDEIVEDWVMTLPA
jgi:RimJ/RimL family protein N-acetyltransferase